MIEPLAFGRARAPLSLPTRSCDKAVTRQAADAVRGDERSGPALGSAPLRHALEVHLRGPLPRERGGQQLRTLRYISCIVAKLRLVTRARPEVAPPAFSQL